MDTQHAQRSAPCTFCELIQGAAEVSICYEDADAIAFMDIQPVNDGHVLVVPREHHESLLHVPEELGLHLFKVTMRLANAIRQVTGVEDLNIIVSSGPAAGQDEPHYHVHIIPRREGDGFDVPLPFDGSEMPDRTVLDANAARIIAAMRDPMRTESGGGSGNRTVAAESMARASTPANAQGTKRASTAADGAAQAEEREASASRSDRPVERQVFDGSVAARRAPERSPRESVLRRVDEGAHGELLYRPSIDDAPA